MRNGVHGNYYKSCAGSAVFKEMLFCFNIPDVVINHGACGIKKEHKTYAQLWLDSANNWDCRYILQDIDMVLLDEFNVEPETELQ